MYDAIHVCTLIKRDISWCHDKAEDVMDTLWSFLENTKAAEAPVLIIRCTIS